MQCLEEVQIPWWGYGREDASVAGVGRPLEQPITFPDSSPLPWQNARRRRGRARSRDKLATGVGGHGTKRRLARRTLAWRTRLAPAKLLGIELRTEPHVVDVTGVESVDYVYDHRPKSSR
ncbi:hypothetical protein V1477_001247 [Vespula maculifrons]|uniref:Uncharacterized protein n=2 Tax=Vespula TaxID=7451 RepID=A0A834IZ31_VESVU|nr:hypothetical protein HZH66_014854 [Vespula vulgaris]